MSDQDEREMWTALEAEVQSAEMAERHRKQATRQRPRRRLGGPPYPTVP